MTNPKQNLLNGIRATAEPHIGNYLGAIKPTVELQDEYNCFFMIANLHSLTTPFEPKELREATIHVVADFIALGARSSKVHALCAIRCARTC